MIRLKKIEYGDVIFADRGFYKHFGIYSGNQKVIHYYHAAEKISLEEFQNSMQGIYTTSVNEFTLDESPQAYKSLDDIIDVIGDTVEIVEVMKPVYNFKAG